MRAAALALAVVVPLALAAEPPAISAILRRDARRRAARRLARASRAARQAAASSRWWRDGGATVLRVRSDDAAGTAAHALRVDLARRPVLAWRWKIDHVIARADLARKSGDDFAARVYVFFDVPTSQLRLGDRIKLPWRKLALRAGAADAPRSATSGTTAIRWERRAWSPYTDRVRTVVLESGTGARGQWVSERRDLDGRFPRGVRRAWRRHAAGDGHRRRATTPTRRGEQRHRVVRRLPPGGRGTGMKRLVLLGGGHAHVEVLRDLAEHPDEDDRASRLVTPVPVAHRTPACCPASSPATTSSTIAPSTSWRSPARAHAAVRAVDRGAGEPGDARGDLRQRHGAGLRRALDRRGHRSRLVGNARGVERHAVVMRPLEKAVRGLERRARARARRAQVGSVTIVGGGAGGVELALAMEYRLRHELGRARAARARHHRHAACRCRSCCRARAAGSQRNSRGATSGCTWAARWWRSGPTSCASQAGIEFASEATFWVAGARRPDWIRDSGLLDRRARLPAHQRAPAVGVAPERVRRGRLRERSRDEPGRRRACSRCVPGPCSRPTCARRSRGAAASRTSTAARATSRSSPRASATRSARGTASRGRATGSWRWKDRIDRALRRALPRRRPRSR